MHSKNSGFTLVELVLVITILGILAATALPKFMNVNQQAHEVAVKGTAGTFGTSIALVKAQWIANGHISAQANLKGFGNNDVDVNNQGYPTDVVDDQLVLNADIDCVSVWHGVMQSPPTARQPGEPIQADYEAAFNNGTCRYDYLHAPNMLITYNPNTGVVTVDADAGS